MHIWINEYKKGCTWASPIGKVIFL
jgi:hypothetical protein